MIPAVYTAREKRLVLAASCLAIFINPLIGTMLNLALPSIGADLGASAHQQGWVTSIYFIVSVMFLMPASRLADIYGKKKVFTAGALVGLFALMMCSLSGSIQMLYLFRGLSGAGVACISCTTVSMISDVYQEHERGAALGINTMCVYIGTSLGPTLGGFITDMFSWRGIFLVIVPFMFLALLCMSRFPYNISSTPDQPFSVRGSAVYGASVLITMFGLISLPEPYAFVLLAAGAAMVVLFLKGQKKEAHPIIDTGMFSDRRYSRAMAALFLNYAAIYCSTFFLSLYLQSIGAMTPTQAGIVMIAQPLMQVVVTPLAGKATDLISSKRILPSLGLLLTAIGLMMFLGLGTTVDIPFLIAAQAVVGLGAGLFSAPNTVAVMSYVPPEAYNKASGLIATMRQVGMMVSMGVATCLISVFLGTETIIIPEVFNEFIQAMRTAWAICIMFCISGMLFSWFDGRTGQVER